MCVNGCWEGPDNTVLHTLVGLTLCNACYLIIENSREEIRSAYVVEEKLAQRRQQAVCSTPTGQGAAGVARAALVLQQNALKVCCVHVRVKPWGFSWTGDRQIIKVSPKIKPNKTVF